MWSVWLFSVIVIFILSVLWWIWIIGLWKLPDGRHWLRGKLGLVQMGGAKLSKSLIQFSVDWQGCFPSLLFDLRLNYGRGNEDNGDLLLKVPCMLCCIHCLRPWTRLPQTHASARDSWTLTGKSGSVSYFSPNQFIYADVISVWFLNFFSMILDFECE